MKIRLKIQGYKVVSTENTYHGLMRRKQLSAKLQYFSEDKWQDVPVVDEKENLVNGPITFDTNYEIFEKLS